MTRPIEEWADFKYEDGELTAHVVPFGQPHALCGLRPAVWLGTGDFEEFEVALTLPRCGSCTGLDPDPAIKAWIEATRNNPIRPEDFL